uniref:Retrovirus-related Pol polyprotein from transposon TNT 1-94 n=1 Tax=Tanacetum cinerariifolium TaxID=118510 RepID=A0A699GZA1_TANCI|nr:hypothetical protein [Tanacetum cinerariifolium]
MSNLVTMPMTLIYTIGIVVPAKLQRQARHCSLNDNPTPDRVLNSSVSFPISKESDNSLSDNSSPEFKTFCDHTKKTRSGNTTTHADDSLPEYDSFCVEIEPDQERLINVVKNDISDNSSNDPLLEEADLFLASDNSIPPGIKNFGYDSKGDIRFLEALLIDDSIPFLNNEASDFDNPSFPRPPLEPPDAEFEPDSRKEILVVMNTIVECESGQRKPEAQWTADERKAANLDHRLKSLIMSVLSDDQINSVISCLTAKSTWDDLILYHKGPSNVKESRVMDLKLCYNIFKFKEGPKKWLSFCQSLGNTNHVKDSELASLFGKDYA